MRFVDQCIEMSQVTTSSYPSISVDKSLHNIESTKSSRVVSRIGRYSFLLSFGLSLPQPKGPNQENEPLLSSPQTLALGSVGVVIVVRTAAAPPNNICSRCATLIKEYYRTDIIYTLEIAATIHSDLPDGANYAIVPS